MTPKEKATELIDNYFVLANGDLPFQQVKQCALIAVDEILNTLDQNLDSSQFKVMNYWNDVKEEIETL